MDKIKSKKVGTSCSSIPTIRKENNYQERTQQLRTYFSKDDLLKNKPESHWIYLSVDKDPNKGSKYFMAFESSASVIYFLETNKSDAHFYEIIPDMLNFPTYVFFDIDRELDQEYDIDLINNYDRYVEEVISTFKRCFEKFMIDMYKTTVKLSEGENTQVSYTSNKKKISFHVKINMKVPNTCTLKVFITNFETYLSSNLYVSAEDKQYLFYYKIVGKEKKYTCIIDPSVYSNFRSFRVLYSSKLKSHGSTPSIPFGSSSPHIKDHLVMVYEDNPQPVISFNFKNLDINCEADFSKIENTHIQPKISTHPSIPPTSSHVSNCLHTKELSRVKTLIETSEEIRKTFNDNKITLQDPRGITTSIFRFTIINHCYCPYAKRVHKHNHCQFDYHSDKNLIKYTCFDDECHDIWTQKNGCIHFSFTPEIDTLKRFVELNNCRTLHHMQDIIKWDQSYEAENMLPYPIKPIVCVRGNMGTGKTVTLVNDFIMKHCLAADTKCLFITYQILLSKKYLNSLEIYGFKNYLDCKRDDNGMINDGKIIFCLDSLWRINTRNFDFIFIDEALSVLLHFNSPLMKNLNVVSSLFELLVLQAKYVYLLDAVVDNQLVYNFVNYISIKKNHAAYWIRNNHIRQSNRKCRLHINPSKGNEKHLKVDSMEKVCKLLKKKRKVVVASSTKTYTIELEAFIRANFGGEHKIMVYNSSTDRSLMEEHASDPNAIWANFDVLIYSPTVGAGLSFERLHFHNLVAYIENSFFTPTIDFTLQQLFRVRCLKFGGMYLYVNNVIDDFDSSNYPVHDHEVASWLDKHTTNMQNYFPGGIMDSPMCGVSSPSDDGLHFDRDRLSYHILKGIILNKNRSLRYFPSILYQTLVDDYNIPCKQADYEPDIDELLESIELYNQIKTSLKEGDTIDWSPSLVVDDDTYNKIVSKHQRGEALSNEELLQKWIYHVAFELWEVQDKGVIDKQFYQKYIGPYDNKHVRQAYESFYTMMRTRDLHANSIDINKEMYQARINKVLQNSQDYNIDLYKTKLKVYYTLLIEGQEIYNSVVGTITTKELEYKTIESRMKDYLLKISDTKYKSLISTFEMDKKAYGDKKKTQEDGKKSYNFFKQVMNIGFGIDVSVSSRGTQNNKRENYDNKKITISTEAYDLLKTKYKPYRLIISRKNEYAFVDDLDDD